MAARDGADEPADFYDDLAAVYHRLYPDWDAAVEEQGRALDLLVRHRLGAGPHIVLDCAVGIGTQLIGLLQRGHRLTGSDVSPGAVARARAEVGRRRLSAELSVADMRALPFPAGRFDAVVCADNAVAHLTDERALVEALREMARVTRAGGLVLVSVRDYEDARRHRPPGTLPQVSTADADQTVAFQVWDWLPDGRRYHLRHFFLTADGGTWDVTERRSTLTAFTAAELAAAARGAGLRDVEVQLPEDTGFFQPVVLGSVPD